MHLAVYCVLFFAETWFAVIFTVIVEIVDPEVSTSLNDLYAIIHFFGSINMHCLVCLPHEYCGDCFFNNM